jgi:hypothetical protein
VTVEATMQTIYGGANGGVKQSLYLARVGSHVVGFVFGKNLGSSRLEDVFIFNLFYKYFYILYYQCDLQRQCCNKLCYYLTQKRFIPVNFGGLYATLALFIMFIYPGSSFHRSDDGGSRHLWNASILQRVYMALHSRRL